MQRLHWSLARVPQTLSWASPCFPGFSAGFSFWGVEVWGAGISRVYLFPIAAVRNDHKLSDLNTTHSLAYNSEGQKSEINFMGLKPRCGRGGISPRGSGGPCFLSSGCLHSLTSSSVATLPFLTLTLPLPSYKDPLMTPGPPE